MNTVPSHIGIIMDGNGRWATRRRLSRSNGHRQGVEALIRTLDHAYELGVYCVSVYAFSTENWKRPKREVDKIFEILREYLRTTSNRLIQNDARFVVMGDLAPLPSDLREEIDRLRAATAHCRSHIFNMGLNYGGKSELVRAVNRMLVEGTESVDEGTIGSYLDTAGLPDPDLIIRTAGEQRLSNFMIWQSAYAELYFADVLWPDFSGEDLDRAVEWYRTRTRKFGDVPAGEKQQ